MPDTKICQGCKDGAAFPVEFTMAFHPIIDLPRQRIWGYEALVRGREGQSAWSILSAVTDENRYAFDQACRVKAIDLAGEKLKGDARLSINFMPNAVYEPRACIRASLAAAARAGFNPNRIMFEFTENEQMTDIAHVSKIIEAYKHIGFITAIDDFGAGFAGLNLLSMLEPDVIKIDMELVRNIDSHARRHAIVSGIATIGRDLGLTIIAEGIERHAERQALADLGITLFQGYLFARPQLETFSMLDEIEGLAA
ncbi:EAL domain-containing protein [Pelagibacterium montanilacus]|uniref:EAL domain-containing protein n=1 Tax=Pelagibacterium montanilacus TaxID=2185280 RepID=UPI000F8CA842|nr:EAL domain-containing protein [Pelagibacterium montanilacus]